MWWVMRNRLLAATIAASLGWATAGLCPAAAESPPENSPRALTASSGLAVQKDYGPYPRPDHGYVSDLAGILTREQQEQMEQWLWSAEEQSGVEIAVVTIRSIHDYPGSANDSIERFAGGLFNAYGIGNQPGNNGVLLLVAQGDREVRIELGAGYGHSRDADTQKIIDRDMLPRFREGKVADGIMEGTKSILKSFAGLRVQSIGSGLFSWMNLLMAGGIVAGGWIAWSLFRNGKRGWGWIVMGLVIVLVILLIKVLMRMSRNMPTGVRGNSSSWSPGGFGGGFGGGFSGGGGATGRW